MQVAASDQQAKAVAGTEESCGGTEWDHDLDTLMIANRLKLAEGVFGLMGCAQFGVEFAQGKPEPSLGDAVTPVSVGTVEWDGDS